MEVTQRNLRSRILDLIVDTLWLTRAKVANESDSPRRTAGELLDASASFFNRSLAFSSLGSINDCVSLLLLYESE